MTWKAFKKQHAIERARVSIHFKEHISSKIVDKIHAILDEKKSDLGLNTVSEESLRGFELQIRSDGGSSTEPLDSIKGWVFQKRMEDAQVVESLTIRGDLLLFETVEYVRWKPFLSRLVELLSDAVSISLDAVDFKKIQMEYWDRFIFEGEKAEANPTLLLRNLEGLLPKSSLDGAMPWHLHKGWFENYEDLRILVHQNGASQDSEELSDSPSLRSLSLYTNLEAHTFPIIENCEQLEITLQKLHERSKSVFSEALTENAKLLVNL